MARAGLSGAHGANSYPRAIRLGGVPRLAASHGERAERVAKMSGFELAGMPP